MFNYSSDNYLSFPAVVEAFLDMDAEVKVLAEKFHLLLENTEYLGLFLALHFLVNLGYCFRKHCLSSFFQEL